MKSLRRLGAAALAAAALGVLPAASPAGVQVGSSGWLWGNPLPQGNTLRAMSFAGTTGYAVGEFGTLLKTTDAGATWSGLPAGTFTDLHEVQAVDNDTVIAAGGCVGRRSDDGGATFARIAFTPVESSCPQPLAAIWFATESTGYLALADGTVFKTTDRGVEFAPAVAIPGTRQQNGAATPTDLVFTSETAGFAATSDGKIFQTTDSGNTWKPVSDTNRGVRAITMIDEKNGYAVGDGSLFLKTTDGGATWTPKDIGAPAPQDLTSIRCASATLCVAATKAGTLLVRTADGGETFAFPTPSTAPIFAAGFASATELVAVGESGSTVRSTDAGLNFAPVGGRLLGRFTRIRAGGAPGSAFAPGPDGTLGKTVDGGRTWTRGNVSTPEDVLDVSFPTVTEGYALDIEGGLFRTSTGGTSWRPLDIGTTADPLAVHATDASTVLLIGPTGVRRSTDGGNAFETVRGKDVQKAGLTAVDRAGSAIVAYGSRDVVRSTDKGRSWKAVRKPGRYVRRGKALVNRLGVSLVDFTDARTGYLVDTSGRLWKTRNGGTSWTELPGVAHGRPYGISFSSANRGYLVIDRFGGSQGRAGFLLTTDDGGATWHPQFVVSTPIPGGGIAATPQGNYLLGGESSLLYTGAGADGDAGGASTLTLKTDRTRYTKRTRIRVTGKLSPASGGELVTVAYRATGSLGWQSTTVKTAANGSFTTSWDLRKGVNEFVAQWPGDFRSQGDGSKVLAVRVGAAK
jgi:photosystem II stability/assembly factor-like uncharacterized protein